MMVSSNLGSVAASIEPCLAIFLHAAYKIYTQYTHSFQIYKPCSHALYKLLTRSIQTLHTFHSKPIQAAHALYTSFSRVLYTYTTFHSRSIKTTHTLNTTYSRCSTQFLHASHTIYTPLSNLHTLLTHISQTLYSNTHFSRRV